MIFEILLLLFSLTVMLLIVYLYRKQWTRAPPTDPVAAPPPPDTTKKCRFLYSDIDNEHTFTVYEDSVKDPYIRVDCDKCNQYVYKTFDGCTRYENFDFGYSVSSSTSGICTNIGFSRPCDQVFLRTLPQMK